MSDLIDKTREIFAPDGLLARAMPGYEARAGQLEMALAIGQTLSGYEHGLTPMGQKLAVEAETGIGKTLAYLVPAALSGKKIIISTGTLNLQEQILRKEIPFLQEHLDPDLKAICMKGRQNYLCRYRWRRRSMGGQLFGNNELSELNNWVNETKTGDRAELNWLADNDPLWPEISASTSQCLGGNCPENGCCFINQLRKKAGRSQLIIVNHHLFFSDLALRRFGFGEVLPRYQGVIFDEAHHIENIATRYFGTSFSHNQLSELTTDIINQSKGKGEIGKKSKKLAGQLKKQADNLLDIIPDEQGRFPLKATTSKIKDWESDTAILREQLGNLSLELDQISRTHDSWLNLARRSDELAANLLLLTGEEENSHVYWLERSRKNVTLSASPVEIGSQLQESLYNEIQAAIFTSATLTTGGNFSYFFERTGLDQHTETITLPSPFNYQERTRLFVPEKGFPEPAIQEFLPQLAPLVEELINASQGRALVLCTSLKAMHFLHQHLAQRLNFPLYLQGSAPKQTLLEDFSRDTNSVLLAVASFWEGVDVPGQSLSCVIIDKLPFEVPSDPVIMARINHIREEGGNPFIDFQVPRAVLSLRQGIGRLMRAASDHGLLAIMDIRLYSKPYGRIFRKSLPDSPVIRTCTEAETFFKEHPLS